MNHLTLKTEGHNQQSRHTKPAVTSVFSWYNKLTTCSRVYPEKLTVSQLVKKFHAHLSYFFPQLLDTPHWALASSLSRFHDHTQTHHPR
jgi:hypothetical protein